MKLLLLGATGLVGNNVLTQALSDGRFSQVIAPTRTSLSPNARLINPVSQRLEDLTTALFVNKPDAVICALGTTQKKAGSKKAFRYVDFDLPAVFAKAAHDAGVDTFAIVTAMGASENCWSFYYRTKGDVEQFVQGVGFRSLTICKPSLIGGKRNDARRAESAALAMLQVLAPMLPRKFRVNPANVIASTLLSAGITAKKGCHWIRSDGMN